MLKGGRLAHIPPHLPTHEEEIVGSGLLKNERDAPGMVGGIPRPSESLVSLGVNVASEQIQLLEEI